MEPMRYTVHAEQSGEPTDFEFTTAVEAVSKAWSLMASGATGLYIYDNETHEAFVPDEFAGLFRMGAQVAQPEAQKQR
jgi:hypothetical protein